MAKLLERLKEKMKTPSLTSEDLSLIVDGKPGSLPSNSPFISTFTKDKINNYFCRVGYVPFTRTCLSSPCIRHELGKDTEDRTLHDLVEGYERAKVKLKQQGFNVVGIFNADITTVTKLRRSETNEGQVRALVARKGGFSVYSIFTNIRTMCVTSRLS